MSKRSIIAVLVVIALAVLGFALSLKKTIAPTNEKPMDVQSEIDKLKKGQNMPNQSVTKRLPQSSAAITTNDANTKAMQLEIKTTQEGSGDRIVKSGDTIGVYYTGKLTDGKIFDSNTGTGKPFEFTVGAGMVIQGWEQGFIGAKVGEKRTLTIPSDLGYGVTGAGGAIPPNATLIFDVELVSIK